ncbi:MAG: hypothetical protein Q9224_007509, partial [Gallowayella concinna]
TTKLLLLLLASITALALARNLAPRKPILPSIPSHDPSDGGDKCQVDMETPSICSCKCKEGFRLYGEDDEIPYRCERSVWGVMGPMTEDYGPVGYYDESKDEKEPCVLKKEDIGKDEESFADDSGW